MTAENEIPQADSDEGHDRRGRAVNDASGDGGQAQARSAGKPDGNADPVPDSTDNADSDGATGKAEQSPPATKDGADEEYLKKLSDRIERAEIEFRDVVMLRNWQHEPEHPRHAFGIRYADEAREKFIRKHGGERTRVAVYRSGIGVFLTPDGHFKWVISRAAVAFDSSEANRLIYEIDAVAEQAREWWLVHELEQPSEHTDGRPRRKPNRIGGQSALQPHMDRAYMVTTQVLAAIDEENARHLRTLQDQPDASYEPSKRFANDLDLARAELDRARALLERAGQRDAQVTYGVGMILGVAVLTLVFVLLGGVFFWRGVPAHYAVAAPAGGIGAVVSVLQRMTSGRLELDVHAGRWMLLAYGAVRPLIGAVFGMVAFVLIAGGLLPSISVSTDAPLAFYAGIGFLAGFNERFAQDMLAGASMQSSPGGSTRR